MTKWPDALRCLWPDCTHVIDEPTGVMELKYLRQHMRLKHGQVLDDQAVLKLRMDWEGRGARERCACGEPLHYRDRKVEEAVRELVEKLGLLIQVTVQGQGVFRASRHYIALHGLKATEVNELVGRGIIERVEP